MFYLNKGSFTASFLFALLLICTFSQQIEAAVSPTQMQTLAKDPVWQALIQAQANTPRISDPTFLLSAEDFSSLNELSKTIELLTMQPSAACRFPARKRYIERQLTIRLSNFSMSNCVDYTKFSTLAPADKIYLVYTSENLTQASSMMGHVMLKIEGTNNKANAVSHAVSFFTELDSINAAKILWESLFIGKQSFFKVSPYQEHIDQYLNAEQRNVWEYQLDFNPEQLQLIHAHLWELKNATIPYFFHTYNCATLTQLLLAIGQPTMSPEPNAWVTPLDVVKSAQANKLISKTTVIAANKWKIRMLQDAHSLRNNPIPDPKIDSRNLANLASRPAESQFLSLKLLESFNLYQLQNGAIDRTTFNDNKGILKAFGQDQNLEQFDIDLSAYKQPIAAPNDSQFSVGMRQIDSENWFQIHYMPASRRLEDDNRQFFSESALELSSLSLLVSAQNTKIELEEWSLYAMRSLVPYEPFTGGVSSQLRIGVQQHVNPYLQRALALDIYSGIGLAVKLSHDLLLYSQMNVGLGFSEGHGYIYTRPEVGLMFYQIFDMKTLVSFSITDNQRQGDQVIKSLALTHSIYTQQNISLHGTFEKKWTNLNEQQSFGLYFKYLY